MFAITAPPTSKHPAYNDHIKACNEFAADDIIEQSEHAAVAMRRNAFLGGKQNSLTDVLSCIGNFFLYARTIVDFEMNDVDTYPLVLHRLSEIATIINNSKLRSLIDDSLASTPWIPHQIILFLQNYFESISLVATNPTSLRNVQTEEAQNKYRVKDFHDSEYCYKSFYDSLRACIVSQSLGFFHHAPKTYFEFFPNASTRNDRDSKKIKEEIIKDVSRQLQQLVVSGDVSEKPPASKLTVRPCFDYMQGKCTRSNEKCLFDHLLFPKDYSKADRIVMEKWVADTNGLSWSTTTGKALERAKASERS